MAEQTKYQGEILKADAEEKKRYRDYINEVTPKACAWKQMLKAFLLGGAICVLGQVIRNICINRFDLDQKTTGSWCSLALILLAVILTRLHLFSGLVRWGGAGALVPITGFANSIASAAMEYKVEGQVFGVGCKVFTIAGPVILYGILSSFLLGALTCLLGFLGF